MVLRFSSPQEHYVRHVYTEHIKHPFLLSDGYSTLLPFCVWGRLKWKERKKECAPLLPHLAAVLGKKEGEKIPFIFFSSHFERPSICAHRPRQYFIDLSFTTRGTLIKRRQQVSEERMRRPTRRGWKTRIVSKRLGCRRCAISLEIGRVYCHRWICFCK